MAECSPTTTAEIDSILKCLLCHNQLTIPTTLIQCFHSYCKSCIEAMPQGNSHGNQGWFCPVCSQFSPLDKIKQNFVIENLISLREKNVKEEAKRLCQQCENVYNAFSMCMECKMYLCDKCQILHLNIPMLKNHHIVSHNKEATEWSMFCPAHQEELIEFNCETCEQLLCKSCKILHHDNHITESIHKALGRLLPQQLSSTDQVNTNTDTLEAQIKGIDVKIEQVKQHYAACRLAMDNKLNVMMSKMKAVKVNVEANHAAQETIPLNILAEMQMDLTHKINKSRQTIDYVNTCTARSKDASLLNEIQGGLFSEVKKQADLPVDNIHYKLPISEFRSNDDNLKERLLGVFGSLNVSDQNNLLEFRENDDNLDEQIKDIFGSLNVSDQHHSIDVTGNLLVAVHETSADIDNDDSTKTN